MGKYSSLKEIKALYNENVISSKQFIIYSNASSKIQEEIFRETAFLNNLNRDVDLIERIWYIINNVSEPQLCPYCSNLKTFTGRVKNGYRPTCNNKKCQSKNYSKDHTGRDCHTNRDNNFIEWQKTIDENTLIDDDFILKHFFTSSGSYIRTFSDKIENPHLLDYLTSRYDDSYSIDETIRRIKLKVEKKPLCKNCGKPVQFIGKASHMFTEYCGLSCSNGNKDVLVKKQESDREKNGGELGWVLSNSNPEKIEKRKNTLMERYGTTIVYDVSIFREKAIATNIKKFGFPYPTQSPEGRKKMIEGLLRNPYLGSGTSKMEQDLYERLKDVYPSLVFHYTSEVYPYNCDFYLPEKDLYIEYQGSQYHHEHPFCPDVIEDIEEFEKLKKKEQELKEMNPDKKNQYTMILKVWTERDPERREFAKKNHINWIELWPTDTFDDMLEKIEKC